MVLVEGRWVAECITPRARSTPPCSSLAIGRPAVIIILIRIVTIFSLSFPLIIKPPSHLICPGPGSPDCQNLNLIIISLQSHQPHQDLLYDFPYHLPEQDLADVFGHNWDSILVEVLSKGIGLSFSDSDDAYMHGRIRQWIYDIICVKINVMTMTMMMARMRGKIVLHLFIGIQLGKQDNILGSIPNQLGSIGSIPRNFGTWWQLMAT